MMCRFSHCITESTGSNITVQERGKRANFLNQNRARFSVTHVDGCVVTTGPRADYLVTKINVGTVIVELKGSDVYRAAEQIVATASHENCLELIEPRKAGLIVCSKVPAFDTAAARAKNLARRRQLRLEINCRNVDVEIENVLPGI
jgi:hypothetical protein